MVDEAAFTASTSRSPTCCGVTARVVVAVPLLLTRVPTAVMVGGETGGAVSEDGLLRPGPQALVAPTVTVPLPAGTTTVADVAVAESTWAAVDPKLMVACSSPSPDTVTCDPLLPGVTEVTSAHESPAATGEPRPVATS